MEGKIDEAEAEDEDEDEDKDEDRHYGKASQRMSEW